VTFICFHVVSVAFITVSLKRQTKLMPLKMSINSFSIHCRAVAEEGPPSKPQMDQILLCWSMELTSVITNLQVEVRSLIHLPLLCHLRADWYRNIKITATASLTPNLWVQLQPLWHVVWVTLDIHLISPSYTILLFSFVSFDCSVSRAGEPVAYRSMTVSSNYCYAKLITK